MDIGVMGGYPLAMKASEREKLLELDRRHVWHPFTQMKDYHEGEEPLLFTHGQGVWLHDGARRYLDAVGSMWTNTLGHNHPALNRALNQQLAKAAHTTLLGATHPAAIRLAKALVDLTPKGLNHVFYSDNGSTAVEVAVKMAYQVMTRRHARLGKKGEAPSLFLSFEGAYHGDTLGAVSVGGVDVFQTAFRPLLLPTVKLPYPAWPVQGVPDTARNRREFLTKALAEAKKVIQQNAHQLVGAVMEPGLAAAGGMWFMVPGYLKGLSRLLKQHGLLLILDEIATGFCRLGPWFVCTQEGVTPDLLVLGKGLTGGYLPLAATLATTSIYDSFLDDYQNASHFFHGHTFTGNPLAAAVCLENLKQLQKPSFQKSLAHRKAIFESMLKPLAAHPLVGQVRVKGFAAGIELMRDKNRGLAFDWGERIGHRVALLLRDEEVFMRPLGSTVVLMPPLSISSAEIRFLARALGRVLNRLQTELEES